jgi:hypothetical protein
MKIDKAFVLESIGLPALTDIALQAAGVASLELREWNVERIVGELLNPVSIGLYRVGGNGRAGGETVSWSAILKVIQSPANVGESNLGEGEDQTHWNYWKRELFVYRSGFLDSLPDGLVAPRCYATQELAGEVACLWLEDVADVYGDAWPLERYALAARHLGRLNGLYASTRPLPDYLWLGQRRLHQWRDLFPQWRTIPWEHPLIRARYPKGEIANLRRMLLESEDFLVRLDRLPQTLCHGDTYPTNFKTRGMGGDEQTVALDWALAHVGPLGYDLGGLALGAYLNLADRGLTEVDAALFDGFMAGLRDSGCQAEEQRVRFGYAASAALMISLFTLGMLGWQLQTAGSAGIDATEPTGGRPCFDAAMADIAYELRDLV